MADSSKKSTGRRLEGIYLVKALPITALPSAPLELCERIIFCKGAAAEKEVEAVTSSHNGVLQLKAVTRGEFKGVMRNVPVGKGITPDSVNLEKSVVTVSRKRNGLQGRVLVLVGVKYRGNVGTIIRSAVQSNSFEKIYLVDTKGTNEQGDDNKTGNHWKKTADFVTEEEVNYYSLQNAPLVQIQRLSSVEEFLIERQALYVERDMIAVELHPTALSLYSKEAICSLAAPNAVLVVGAEDCGVPNDILHKCSSIVEIPSLSASINVSCAFMAVLTVMNMAQVDGIWGGKEDR